MLVFVQFILVIGPICVVNCYWFTSIAEDLTELASNAAGKISSAVGDANTAVKGIASCPYGECCKQLYIPADFKGIMY